MFGLMFITLAIAVILAHSTLLVHVEARLGRSWLHDWHLEILLSMLAVFLHGIS